MSSELSIFIPGETGAFQAAMEMAKVLGSSTMVPEAYRASHPSGPANCLIAIDLAKRLNMNPLEVMQNLEVVEGTPSWKSKYIIEKLERSVKDYKYEYVPQGDKTIQYDCWVGPKGQKVRKTGSLTVKDVKCRIVVTHENGDILKGPWVSIEMAIKEGWYTRSGSKWPNMPEKMLAYAAVRDFNKLYPVVSMVGMPTSDEVMDSPEAFRSELTQRGDVIEELNTFTEVEVIKDPKNGKAKASPPDTEEEDMI